MPTLMHGSLNIDCRFVVSTSEQYFRLKFIHNRITKRERYYSSANITSTTSIWYCKKNWITFLSLESISWKIVEYVKRVDHFELDDRLKGGASVTVKWNTSWFKHGSRFESICYPLLFRVINVSNGSDSWPKY